jgi:hypothetical protein
VATPPPVAPPANALAAGGTPKTMGAPATAMGANPAAPAGGAAPPTGASSSEGTTGGPKDAGYIIKIEGYHFHNDAKKFAMSEIGEEYLRKTLIDGLENGKVTLPTADRMGTEKVSMKELGIGYPVLWKPEKVEIVQIDNPKYAGGAVGASGNPAPADENAAKISVPQFKFNVQFCWQPKLPSKRLDAKMKAEKDKGSATDTAATNP